MTPFWRLGGIWFCRRRRRRRSWSRTSGPPVSMVTGGPGVRSRSGRDRDGV